MIAALDDAGRAIYSVIFTHDATAAMAEAAAAQTAGLPFLGLTVLAGSARAALPRSQVTLT